MQNLKDSIKKQKNVINNLEIKLKNSSKVNIEELKMDLDWQKIILKNLKTALSQQCYTNYINNLGEIN